AAWWLLWNQAKQGKTAAAIASAQNDLKKYPHAKSAPRFAFWIGKLQERSKQAEAAKAAYKRVESAFGSNYYGYRAHARLQALSGDKDRGWDTNPSRAEPNLSWAWPDLPQLMSFDEVNATYGATAAELA